MPANLSAFLVIALGWMSCHLFPRPAVAYDREDLLFLKDYITLYTSPMQRFYITADRSTDVVKAASLVSKSLRRFITLQPTEEALASTANSLTTYLLHLESSHNWMEILNRAKKLDLFRKPYQWVLLGRNTTNTETNSTSVAQRNSTVGTDVWTYLSRLPIYVDSDLKVALKEPNGRVSVTSPYKIHPGGDMIKENLAEWTKQTGLVVLNKQIAARRRMNLQGLVITASIVVRDPKSLIHMNDMVDKHVDTTMKVSTNALRLLEPMLNMSLKLRTNTEGGDELANGSWTGVVGDLIRGDSIISASPLFLIRKRVSLIEYYATVNPTEAKFIYMSPPLSHSKNIFLLPFDAMVWICCLTTIVVGCTLLYLAIKYELPDTDSGEKIKSEQVMLTDVIMYNVGALCQQGTAVPTEHPAARTILLIVHLTYMFLYTSYSAFIVAILQSSDTSMQTLQDLLRSPMIAAADNVAYSQLYFKLADDPIRKRFYENKIVPSKESPHFYPPEEGIKRVREGMFAFHVETSVGYQIIQKTFTEEEKCGLLTLPMSFFKVKEPWLPMKKHNPYSELFRIGMYRVIESGYKNQLYKKYYTKKPNCGAKSSRFVSVGMSDCYPAFMFIIFGISLSLVILLIEFTVKVSRKKFLERQRRHYMD